MKKVQIIGAGIIGLCTAYYLQAEGCEVEVIDKSDLSDGCSFGNAGMVVPSHFVPLAAPGIISKGIRWMFSQKSPFYIKPRLSFELIQWLWQFHKSCTPKKMSTAIPILKDMGLLSKYLYQELAKHPELDFHFEEQGLMMLFQKQHTFEEEKVIAQKANDIGIEAKILDSSEVKKIETGTSVKTIGGVFYPGDAHLYPNKLMQGLIKYLKKSGVHFRGNTQVLGFDYQAGKVNSIKTNKETIPVDEIILAGGAWTSKMMKWLGLKMLLQDGKGYSVTLKEIKEKPKIPSILSEAKVAITPMQNHLRIGGTLEISNLSSSINKKRVEGILDAVPHYFPNVKISKDDIKSIWHGFRPCTPDGLPYIGRSKTFSNLTIATGHAMMGLSLGPITGKMISEIITNKKPSINSDLLDPHRF